MNKFETVLLLSPEISLQEVNNEHKNSRIIY